MRTGLRHDGSTLPDDDLSAGPASLWRLASGIQLLAFLLSVAVWLDLLVHWFWPRLLPPAIGPSGRIDLVRVALALALSALSNGLSAFRQWPGRRRPRWVARAVIFLAPPVASLALLGARAAMSISSIMQIVAFGLAGLSFALNVTASTFCL